MENSVTSGIEKRVPITSSDEMEQAIQEVEKGNSYTLSHSLIFLAFLIWFRIMVLKLFWICIRSS